MRERQECLAFYRGLDPDGSGLRGIDVFLLRLDAMNERMDRSHDIMFISDSKMNGHLNVNFITKTQE